MSLTFGERIAAIEEKLDSLAAVVEVLLQSMGLMDAEGNWVEIAEPAALPGD